MGHQAARNHTADDYQRVGCGAHIYAPCTSTAF